MPFHTFCSAKFSTCIAVRLLKFSVLHGKGESKYRPVATNFQCLKNCCPLSHPCWGKRLSGQSPSICCRRPRCHLKAPLGLSLLHFVSQTRTCRSLVVYLIMAYTAKPRNGQDRSLQLIFIAVQTYKGSVGRDALIPPRRSLADCVKPCEFVQILFTICLRIAGRNCVKFIRITKNE